MAVDWGYYDKFERAINTYLPDTGEGDNMATQTVTAVVKLVYKWYNDGDVYDNRWAIQGWCNDLSSYANWLAKYQSGETGADMILAQIAGCRTEGDYEDILKELADTLLDDEWLEVEAKTPKVGSIYDCEGMFEFEDEPEDEWDELDEEDW